jgi:hypothetical protein
MNCVVYDKLLFHEQCGEDGNGYILLEKLDGHTLLWRPWHILEHKFKTLLNLLKPSGNFTYHQV